MKMPVKKKPMRKKLNAMKRKAGKYAKRLPKQLDHLIVATFFLVVVAASVYEAIQNERA